MSKKIRFILLGIILSFLIISVIISFSYGYYVVSSNETHEMSTTTNTPSCVGLHIQDNKLINLSGDYAVPLKDEQVLNSASDVLENFKYSFTVTNNCDTDATMAIGLAPFKSSSISIFSLKYVLIEKDASLPKTAQSFSEDNMKNITEEMMESINKKTGESSNYVHNFSDIMVPANSSKEYELYMWLNSDAGNDTMSKTFKGALVLNKFSSLVSKSLASYIKEDVYKTKQNNTNPSGTAGLYFHDSTLVNGSQDNTYRYAGAIEDVNNYVCFYGDDCTNKANLYRIISVDSTGVTKVIKATSLVNKPWNEKAGYVATGTTQDIAIGLTNGRTYTNIWAIKRADGSYYTSSLNDYLNGEYLTSMMSKTSAIVDTTWVIGGAGGDLTSLNVHDFMLVELNFKGTYTSKVGLMYGYEYGYAALPEYWSFKLGGNQSDGYQAIKKNDWLIDTSFSYQWFVTRYSDAYALTNGFSLYYVGRNTVSSSRGVRPVFGLSSSAIIINQNEKDVGSKNNPMLIM